MLVDRTTLALSILRIKNLGPELKIRRINQFAYHPWHARGEEIVAKGFLKNRYKLFTNNKKIIKAERGLEYLQEHFTYSVNDGTVEFRKVQ
jgi:hypothetical protein